MSETLYVKRGRRYVPARTVIDDYALSIPVGSFVLIHAYNEGGRMYHYEIKPDNASFFAAAQVCKQEMREAMEKVAPASPMLPKNTPYTEKQLSIIEEFKQRMVEAGGLLPTMWTLGTVQDMAEAGINAVLEKSK